MPCRKSKIWLIGSCGNLTIKNGGKTYEKEVDDDYGIMSNAVLIDIGFDMDCHGAMTPYFVLAH